MVVEGNNRNVVVVEVERNNRNVVVVVEVEGNNTNLVVEGKLWNCSGGGIKNEKSKD